MRGKAHVNGALGLLRGRAAGRVTPLLIGAVTHKQSGAVRLEQRLRCAGHGRLSALCLLCTVGLQH